ncbi:conserved Plasmodium protein, unknown function [Plasmodium sp. DRC-Itaito]|nr:conserved Plasmodium protein, unknown function [Plasmodium sp. DRC-Itaito]
MDIFSIASNLQQIAIGGVNYVNNKLLKKSLNYEINYITYIVIGENEKTPYDINMFFLPFELNTKLTFKDFKKYFPFKGNIIFRFKIALCDMINVINEGIINNSPLLLRDKNIHHNIPYKDNIISDENEIKNILKHDNFNYVWIDITNDEAFIPTFNGSVIVKVLFVNHENYKEYNNIYFKNYNYSHKTYHINESHYCSYIPPKFENKIKKNNNTDDNIYNDDILIHNKQNHCETIKRSYDHDNLVNFSYTNSSDEFQRVNIDEECKNVSDENSNLQQNDIPKSNNYYQNDMYTYNKYPSNEHVNINSNNNNNNDNNNNNNNKLYYEKNTKQEDNSEEHNYQHKYNKSNIYNYDDSHDVLERSSNTDNLNTLYEENKIINNSQSNYIPYIHISSLNCNEIDIHNKSIVTKGAIHNSKYNLLTNQTKNIQNNYNNKTPIFKENKNITNKINNRLQELKEYRDHEQAKFKEKVVINDQIKKQINKWCRNSDNTYKDIKVLLTTLNEVLWKNAQWKNVYMADLISNPNVVKSVYKNAILLCHPDKNRNTTTEQELRAEMIFQALNNSYKNKRNL